MREWETGIVKKRILDLRKSRSEKMRDRGMGKINDEVGDRRLVAIENY